MGNKQLSSRRSSRIEVTHRSITPLYEACRDGDEEQVQRLLPNYTLEDLNRPNPSDNGNTCLHIATANGHDHIVEILLKRGSQRSSILNAQNQSPYDVAAKAKETTRSLFVRRDENDPTQQTSLRFYETDASNCFEVVQLEDEQDGEREEEREENAEKPASSSGKKPSVQTYKTEEEIKHEIGYSASSKTMCQSKLARFFVNHLHSDEPLNHKTTTARLKEILQETGLKEGGDYLKIDKLIQEYEDNSDSVEDLIHLYTLETQFYRVLKKDCLPLAIPLFIHLPKLKHRYFQGRVYRGMHLTYEQLETYQHALSIPGTRLQTTSFSSTSMDRTIAEQFINSKTLKQDRSLCVLFIFDFPNLCDQAINLGRVSKDKPCLSEYENEKEVLILPWTIFEVTRIEKPNGEDDIYTLFLTNIIIPKKNLLSTFKWTWVDLRKHLVKEKKIKLDCAFQKHKTFDESDNH